MTHKIVIYLKCMLILCMGSIGLLPAPADAQTMNVLYLDGNGAHAELPSEMFHQFTESTVETWVKWERIQNWSRIFDFGREGNAMVVQSEKSSRTLNFAIYDRSGNRHRIQAKNAIPKGQWFHLAVTSGSQGMTLYINGELAGADPYTGGLEQVTGGQYYIGRSNWPNDKPFQGYISEFRIWNCQRSQTEIQRTMQRRLTGKEPELGAYWHFDQAQNDQISNAISTQGAHPARLIQNAHLVPVPPVARYLMPGEIEKDKLARQTSAQANWERGNYIAAYRDYQAALDLSPGDTQIRTDMLKALEKSQIRAALLPFRTSNADAKTDVAYITTQTDLSRNRPAYINWLTPTTLQFALYDQGVSKQSSQQELIDAAKAWNIRIIILSTITENTITKSRPKRESETAYLRLENQTISDSLRSVRYNNITQNATATSQATLQVIDVETGRILDNQILNAQINDQIEYADYSGDPYALWAKRGSRYKRLITQEARFLARKELKTDHGSSPIFS
jgi:hypothetical protein